MSLSPRRPRVIAANEQNPTDAETNIFQQTKRHLAEMRQMLITRIMLQVRVGEKRRRRVEDRRRAKNSPAVWIQPGNDAL